MTMNSTINPFLKQKQSRIDPDATLLHRFRSLFREKSSRHLTKMFNLLCSLGSAEVGTRISLAQFKKGMEKFVNGKELLSALDVAKIFYLINADGSGKLTCLEFVQHVQGVMSSERQKVVQFVFSRLKNKDNGWIEESDLMNYWTDMENKGHPLSPNPTETKSGLFIREYGTDGKITKSEFIDYYMNLNFLTKNDRSQFISSCLNEWGMTRSDYDNAISRSATKNNVQEKMTMVKPISPIHLTASCDSVHLPYTPTNVPMKDRKTDVHAVDNLVPTNKKGSNQSCRDDDMGVTRRAHDVYTQKDNRFDNLKQPIPTRATPSNWPYTQSPFVEGRDDDLQPTIVLVPTTVDHSIKTVNKVIKPVPSPLIVIASELQQETSTTAKNNMDKFDALARLALADKAQLSRAAAQNPRDGRNLNVSVHCKSLHAYGSSSSFVPKPPLVGSPRKRGMIVNSDPTTDNSGYSRDNTDGSGGYSSNDYSPSESVNNTRPTSPTTMMVKDLSNNDSPITTGGTDSTQLGDQYIKSRSSSHGPRRTSSPRSRHDYGNYTNIEIVDYELDRSISNRECDELDRSVSGHKVALEVPELMQREPSISRKLDGLGSSRHGLGSSRHGVLHTSFADNLSEQAVDHSVSALPSIHPTIVAVPILKRQTSSSRNTSFDYLNATLTAPQSSPQQQSSLSPHKSGEQMINITQRDMETIMKRLSALEVTVNTLQKQLKDQQIIITDQQQLIASHTVNIESMKEVLTVEVLAVKH